MTVLVVPIRVETIEAPEHGKWCPACALPSAVTGCFALFIGSALQSIVRVTRCTDCGTEVHS